MPDSTPVTHPTLEIVLAAYHNCDDVQLFWRTRVDGQLDGIIPGCLGFMLERQRIKKNGEWGASEVLRNRVGFSDSEVNADGTDTTYPTKKSSIWPFQLYEWTDHGANSGQVVRYRVRALRLPEGGVPDKTELDPFVDSAWTDTIAVTADCGSGVSAYFNRGFVMSQFVARLMRLNGWTAADIPNRVKDLEEPLRRFLSGELRLALLRLLDEAIEDPGLELYAALFELLDEELIDRLKLLKGRAHIVLTNGASGKVDENVEARAALKLAGAEVDDRLLGTSGLGHNKFAILVNTSDGKPLKAWTGSTNWSPTGLCTQVNNGILFEDEAVARIYLDQWGRLKAANGDFTPILVKANAESPRISQNTAVWFTRVRNPSKKNVGMGIDLQELVDLVNHAESVILYVMFSPGKEPLQSILARASERYVRGVVSTVSSSLKEQFFLKGIDLNEKEFRTALVQPEGIAGNFSAWVGEVTRSQFLPSDNNPGIGYAITHSKMIVIDPFSDQCKVITGSHNFSISASEGNDDNFVVIQGNRRLAEAYAVACLATYDHYLWRAQVKEQIKAHKPVWDHLSDDPQWQAGYLTDERKQHLAIWCHSDGPT